MKKCKKKGGDAIVSALSCGIAFRDFGHDSAEVKRTSLLLSLLAEIQTASWNSRLQRDGQKWYGL